MERHDGRGSFWLQSRVRYLALGLVGSVALTTQRARICGLRGGGSTSRRARDARSSLNEHFPRADPEEDVVGLCVYECLPIHARGRAERSGRGGAGNGVQGRPRALLPKAPSPLLRAPSPAKGFSQTDGIWRDRGRDGDGRGDFVPEPLVWG